jgi:hypothetical protein
VGKRGTLNAREDSTRGETALARKSHHLSEALLSWHRLAFLNGSASGCPDVVEELVDLGPEAHRLSLERHREIRREIRDGMGGLEGVSRDGFGDRDG